ncbi:ComF family protein [Arthrobacter alpinus]|nr:phosphoribosyltransferase family protein [Arthrobacter alpinus]
MDAIEGTDGTDNTEGADYTEATDAQELGAGQAGRHRGHPRALWLRASLWCAAAWRDFLYLVMPADCVVCGAEDHTLCPECSAALRQQTAAPFRAEHSADALVGVAGNSLLPVIAAGEYRDALSQAILGFKNHGRTELGPPLARCLARALLLLNSSSCTEQPPTSELLLLVPIPSTGSGWRRRGYDPVALILRAVTREARLPSGMELVPLLRIKAKLPWHTTNQKGLGRAARRRNVRNTMAIAGKTLKNFRLKANPSGQSVILIDDVLTTGSTLREAAKTLENAGFCVRAAVVLAAARAPSPNTESTTEE